MNDIKHLFFCINDGYIYPFCVALASILENNQKLLFEVHIVASDLSDESKAKISKLKIRYKNFKFDVSIPPSNICSEFTLAIDYISQETYFRYFIANMFPLISNGLYLDADLICNGDLSELFEIKLDGYYMAGVRDNYLEKDMAEYKQKILGHELYINAGVLLCNLDSIRKDNMTDRLIETTLKLMKTVKYQDQDILNIVFRSKIKELPNKYNFTSSDFFATQSELKNAKIIHWTGPNKPWKKKLHDSRQKIYIKYTRIYNKISSRKSEIGIIIADFFRLCANCVWQR